MVAAKHELEKNNSDLHTELLGKKAEADGLEQDLKRACSLLAHPVSDTNDQWWTSCDTRTWAGFLNIIHSPEAQPMTTSIPVDQVWIVLPAWMSASDRMEAPRGDVSRLGVMLFGLVNSDELHCNEIIQVASALMQQLQMVSSVKRDAIEFVIHQTARCDWRFGLDQLSSIAVLALWQVVKLVQARAGQTISGDQCIDALERLMTSSPSVIKHLFTALANHHAVDEACRQRGIVLASHGLGILTDVELDLVLAVDLGRRTIRAISKDLCVSGQFGRIEIRGPDEQYKAFNLTEEQSSWWNDNV